MEKEIAKVLIIMLKARREVAGHYIFNNDMTRECALLDREIEALERLINGGYNGKTISNYSAN